MNIDTLTVSLITSLTLDVPTSGYKGLNPVKKFVVAIGLACALSSSPIWAGANCEGFNTQGLNCFENGTTANADTVNANFKALLSKIDQLQAQVTAQNSAKVEIQSGIYESNGAAVWAIDKGTGPRSFTIFIAFAKSFSSPPKVNVSPGGISAYIPTTGLNFEARAVDITASGFNLKLSTWGDTQILNVGIQWVAYVSP
jgi:hypothetical protein